MKPDTAPQALLAAIDADTMLREVQDWAAINTGTGNISGLDRMARILADAFSTLPGDVELVEPAKVTAISPEGREYEKPHGKHMVLRVRPEADRRFVLTGHMDTVFPEDHPFQQVSWLDDDTIVQSVRKTGKLLVVHEDTRTGGIAGEIAMRVSEKAFEWLDGPILRVTAIDSPVPYSGSLEDYFLPQTDDILTAARYLAAY